MQSRWDTGKVGSRKRVLLRWREIKGDLPKSILSGYNTTGKTRKRTGTPSNPVQRGRAGKKHTTTSMARRRKGEFDDEKSQYLLTTRGLRLRHARR